MWFFQLNGVSIDKKKKCDILKLPLSASVGVASEK